MTVSVKLFESTVGFLFTLTLVNFYHKILDPAEVDCWHRRVLLLVLDLLTYIVKCLFYDSFAWKIFSKMAGSFLQPLDNQSYFCLQLQIITLLAKPADTSSSLNILYCQQKKQTMLKSIEWSSTKAHVHASAARSAINAISAKEETRKNEYGEKS